jgi:hypothetical protein
VCPQHPEHSLTGGPEVALNATDLHGFDHHARKAERNLTGGWRTTTDSEVSRARGQGEASAIMPQVVVAPTVKHDVTAERYPVGLGHRRQLIRSPAACTSALTFSGNLSLFMLASKQSPKSM